MDRENEGIFGKLVVAIGVAMSLVHIYLLGFNPITPWILYNIHLAFGIVLVFLLYPATKRSPMGRPSVLDIAMALLAVAAAVYFSVEMEELIYRIGVAPTAWDLFFSAALVIMVLEITRRTSGPILPTFAALFLLYARYGGCLPGILGHRGYDWSRIVSYVTGLDAIFSVSLGASAQFVFLLLLFSAFLHATGAGKFFIDFATGVAGDKRGGPAKIAVLASALFGTISGNSVANVVSTGVFTIPMMKRIGYKPAFAGAVEAVASTGGQIMPPIMGSAAFIMAQLIGVSYLKIATSALIPAVLYFLSVIFMVDLEAGKYGLKGVPKDELPSVRHVLRTQGYLVTPVLVLIFVLVVLRASVIRAALWAIASVIVVTAFKRETRMGLARIISALYDGAKGSVGIISSCACAGIVIGVLSLTGAGLKFAQVVLALSHGNLLPALVLSAVASLVLGMGLPTTASYLICAAVAAPALIELGVSPLAAHMFIFYYACISAITPPVALAAYAGAGLAKANPMRVGVTAVRLGLVAYIVPFMFVYGPPLLAQGGLGNIMWAAVTAIIGVWALAMGIEGWMGDRAIGSIARALLIVAALTLIKPGLATDIIGLGLFAIILVVSRVSGALRRRRQTLVNIPPSE